MEIFPAFQKSDTIMIQPSYFRDLEACSLLQCKKS